MLESGIYSVILKWGLETVSGVVRDKDPNHIQILLEAIKLRNAIVLKRFDYSWAAAQELVELVAEVETDLAILISSLPPHEKKAVRLSQFTHKIGEELHPKYLRRLRKIRGKFEATNDLMSAYSLEFLRMLSFDNVKTLFKKNDCDKLSDGARLYRQLWDTYSAVMLTLIRVTSSDIRFWVTDVTYFPIAEEYAKRDRNSVQVHFTSGSHDVWALEIESHAAVSEFWKAVESGCS